MRAITLLIFLALNTYIKGQEIASQWAISNGSTNFERGQEIALSTNGAILESGIYYSNVDLNPDPLEEDIVLAQGGSDIYLRNLDSLGNLIWAKSFGTISNEDINNLIVDQNGDIFIIGRIDGDLLIIKCDNNGNTIWQRSIDSNWVSEGTSAGLTRDGELVVVGYFQGTVDFDPDDASVFNLTSTGWDGSIPHYLDCFVLKLDVNGNFLWAINFGGETSDVLNDIIIDEFNNIILSGWFTSTVDLDPGLSSFELTSLGQDDAFILKLDENGSFLWADSFGSGGHDNALSLELSTNNDILVGGYFQSNKAIIKKYSPSGSILFEKEFGNSTYPGQINNIKKSSNNTFVTLGNFTNRFNLNNGNADDLLISKGGTDIFIGEFDLSGNYLRSMSIGGPNEDYSRSITLDNESIFLNGYFADSIFFSNNIGYLASEGANDIFVSKISPCIHTTASLKVESCDFYKMPSGRYNVYRSGTYSDVITNGKGCDSLLTIDVTIRSLYNTEINEEYCDSYFFGGEEINKSGSYYDTLVSEYSCDSIVKLNLKIHPSIILSRSLEVCDSYLDNTGSVIDKSGTIKEVFLSKEGCDSTLITDLIVNKSVENYMDISSCDQIIFDDLKINANGRYIKNFVSHTGCDSLVVLDYVNKKNFENLLIPNVITPNGDGLNDYFKVDERLVGSKIRLYNRWGGMVYESDNYQNNWRSKGLSSGVYFYEIISMCDEKIRGTVTTIK